MKKAYNKDVWRSIRNGKKRFFSIVLITALGVTMLTGLTAACVDLRSAADTFFDEQKLFDICVVSTLGLTDEDVAALGGMEGIEAAQGAYSETVHTKIGEKNATAEVKTLGGMNIPYLCAGKLPGRSDEIAVTEKYIQESGKAIGDTLTIEEEQEEAAGDDEEESGMQFHFPNTVYTITGVVTDAADINNPSGSVSFRAAASTDYTFFVRPEAVESEVYTAVYLQLAGSSELFCYSDAYEELAGRMVRRIEEQVKGQREQARYDEVIGEAEREIGEAEAEINDRLAEAEAAFSDAERELSEGREELLSAERELLGKEKEAKREFAEAREALSEGRRQLAEAQTQLTEAEKELNAGEAELAEAKKTLAAERDRAAEQFASARGALAGSRAETQAALGELTVQFQQVKEQFGGAWPEREWELLRQTAGDAYAPAVRAQARAAQLQKELAATEPSASEYAQIREELEAELTAAEAAEAAVAGTCAFAQEAFLGAFLPVAEAAVQGIDYQIMMLDPGAADYEAQTEALTAQKAQLQSLGTELPKLALGLGQLDAAGVVSGEQEAQISEQEAAAGAQFAEAQRQIEESEAQLIYGKEQAANGSAELEDNRKRLDDGEAELAEQEEEAERQIADGKAEIEENREKLKDGERELLEEKKKYESDKAEAAEKIREARDGLAEIDLTQWYVQDRSSLSGYANVGSDADSIEALGTVFPAVFFVVAVLISLTTITRMVEEDRGLIGTYKALGFTDKEIRRKYLTYACLACLAGGILGDIGGFVVLPKIIFVFFRTMYLLPDYPLRFDSFYGIGGMGLFVLGIVGATAAACFAELRSMPAELMRPKAPRSGSRVFLEYVTPLWKRLSFLNKVTARNLFRYKKRLFMTIAGIMGCMALLLFGFAVKDSVTDLMPRQYEQTYRYDLMAVSTGDDNEKLLSYMEPGADYLNLQIASVKLINPEGDEEKVQMFVIPEDVPLDRYLSLEMISGEAVQMDDAGIYVTRNAANVLGFGAGDMVSVQDLSLRKETFPVSGIVKNYLGNNVYISKALYESLSWEYEPNGVLVNLPEEIADPIAYADELGAREGVLSAVSTKELKDDFSKAFALINMVVYVVIIMAASLAFVVLFTLSSTNISERCRELATIKVLGFYDSEVHLYVNKETLILTVIGIVLGLPLGYVFAGTLTYILNMPSIYLEVSLHGISFVISAAMSFGFALVVDLITNRSLDGIDPVEALKSVE